MSPIRLITITLLCVAVVSSCGSPATSNDHAGNNASGPPRSGGAAAQGTPSDAQGLSATQACYEVDVGKGSKVLRAQTFAIDFEPFKNSCFVTTHDPDFTNPPLNSEIAIYKDGKKLPQAFQNGPPGEPDVDKRSTGFPASGCWVVAVAFQDVNADRFTDVVVVGKCQAKMGDYNENLVYLNNGNVLFTRPDVNVNLIDLKSIGEVVKYTKENPRLFSLIIDAADRNS